MDVQETAVEVQERCARPEIKEIKDYKVVLRMFKYLRQDCSTKFLWDPEQISGTPYLVQVDESMFQHAQRGGSYIVLVNTLDMRLSSQVP